MQAAERSPAEPSLGGGASNRQALPIPSVPAQAVMDPEFIARNQIVERYLGGRLPLKGAQDFERYCREHPQLLDEIGLLERINAALRLLEAGGRSPPWESRGTPWWQKPPVVVGAGVVALACVILALTAFGKLSSRDHTIAALQRQAAIQALDPAESTRTITIIPNRTSPSTRSLLTIGGSKAEMDELRIDVSWANFTAYRVTIDRMDQGRVAVLHNVLRDSSGVLHLGLNSSALGPGKYQFSIDGLTWKGEPVPAAWATITIVH
jgi:hypothetical protein